MMPFDVTIIGSGFSGSLLAWILAKHGRSVLLVDRCKHPRFAIGESSTPIADRLLERLAERHGLKPLAPLARYGSWMEHYPHLMRGKKRGFSYFHHRKGQPFVERTKGGASLLVAASPTDASSDTHWLRADVDQFLAEQAVAAGVECWNESEVARVTRVRDGWAIEVRDLAEGAQGTSPQTVRCGFVVDASGPGQVLRRQLGLRDATAGLRTNSSACYTHLQHVAPAHPLQFAERGPLNPFNADDAAQHHLLDDSWVWMLRFDDGRTSVGRVFRHPARAPQELKELEVALGLDDYPGLAALLQNAVLAPQPGKWICSGRLQSWCGSAIGDGFALMPPTYLRLDPLHSTGIAHGISGVERLSECLLADDSADLLTAYASQLHEEAVLLDRLVAACYLALNDFNLFELACSLYFIMAVAYEERRAGDQFDWVKQVRRRQPAAVWQADDRPLRSTVESLLAELECLCGERPSDPGRVQRFYDRCAAVLEPWNRCGLFDRSVHRQYAYTSTKSS